MRRYVVSTPTLEWSWEIPAVKTLTVIESDRAPQFTGLYDAAGNKLMAIDAPDQIGFVRFGPTR